MTKHPLISIIIPLYNAEATIRSTLDSVQTQTLGDWELIVVDDESSDRSPEIVHEFALADDRISLYRQRNGGPSIARNYGIRLAHGRYVAFLDADDLWAPPRLAGMVEAFDKFPGAGVLFSRTRFIDTKSITTGTLTPHHSHLTLETLLAENPVCSTSNIICRAKLLKDIGGFMPGLNFAEDQDWLVRVALDGNWTIKGIDAEWFFYRSSQSSQSSDLSAMRRGWFNLVARAAIQDRAAVQRVQHKAFAQFHRQLARRALRLRRPSLACSFIFQALLVDPGLIIRQPRRTGLTLIAALATTLPFKLIRELVAR